MIPQNQKPMPIKKELMTNAVALARQKLIENKFPFYLTKGYCTLTVESMQDCIEIKWEGHELARALDMTKKLALRAQKILECQFEMKRSPCWAWYDDIAYLYPDRKIKGYHLNIDGDNLGKVKEFAESIGIEIRYGSDENDFYETNQVKDILKWENLIFPYHTGIAYMIDKKGWPNLGSRYIKKVPEYNCSPRHGEKMGIDPSEQISKSYERSFLFIEYNSNVKGDFEEWQNRVKQDFTLYSESAKKYETQKPIETYTDYEMTDEEINEATYWFFEGDTELLYSHFNS